MSLYQRLMQHIQSDVIHNMRQKGSIPGDKGKAKCNRDHTAPHRHVLRCRTLLLLQSLLNRACRARADGTAIKWVGEYCTKRRRKGWEWKPGAKCVLLTCRLYKLWVGIICDEWNWQIPEVQFKCTSDNIDIFIHIHRNISFFPICVEKALTLKAWKRKQM